MKIGAAVGTVGGAVEVRAPLWQQARWALSALLPALLASPSAQFLVPSSAGSLEVQAAAPRCSTCRKLDRHVFANNLCLACNHPFNLPA
jgi:hypothetical protein